MGVIELIVKILFYRDKELLKILNFSIKDKKSAGYPVFHLFNNMAIPLFLSTYLIFSLVFPESGFTGNTLYFFFLIMVNLMIFSMGISHFINNIDSVKTYHHLPVSKKNIEKAEVIIFIIRYCLQNIFFTLPGIVTAFILRPATEAVTILFLTFTCLIFTVLSLILLYILLLKFIVKLNRKIGIFLQVIYIAAPMTVYMFMGTAFDFIETEINLPAYKWYYYLMPHFWYSSVLRLFEVGFLVHHAIMGILSVLSLFILIYICNKLIFGKIYSISEKFMNIPFMEKKEVYKENLYEKAFGFLLKSNTERAFFNFNHKILFSNNQHTAMIVFSFFIPVFVITSFVLKDDGNSYTISKYFILSILLTVAFIMALLAPNENYKASDLFNILPVNNLKKIYKGISKSIILRIIFPLYIMLSVLYYFKYSSAIIPFLIFNFITFNIGAYYFLIYTGIYQGMPFSKDIKAGKEFGFIAGIYFFCYISFLTVSCIFYELFSSNYLALTSYIAVVFLIILLIKNYRNYTTGYRKKKIS